MRDETSKKNRQGRRTTKMSERLLREHVRARLLEAYSDDPSTWSDSSWEDLSEKLDNIAMMIDALADQYNTSGWLAAASSPAQGATHMSKKLEQLYRDAEAIASDANDAFGSQWRAPRGSKGTGPERVQARVSPARSSSAGLREAVRDILGESRRKRVYAFTMVQGPEDNEPQDRDVIVGWVEDKDGNELESWRIPLQKYSVGKFARMVYKKYGPVEVEGVDDENVSIGPDGRASKSHYPDW